MNLTSLPIVGQLYLPILLTSLIIGMLILILLEKRRTSEKETNVAQKGTLRENSVSLPPTQGSDVAASKERKSEKVPNIETQNEENDTTEQGLKTKENHVQETSSHSSSASSCSNSSGSEEEAAQSLVSRPRRVAQRPKKKKKHACKGSAILCATKRKVTAVTIITDSQEEEVQVSLEELAEEIRSQGVTCSVHPATTTRLPPLSSEPSHLLLLFGTTSEGCKRLQESLSSAVSGGRVGPTPLPQPFLFSVTCWSAAASGDVFESARDLSTSLAGCGGAEWLPVTCITSADETEEQSDPPVVGRQQYVKTVMDKITKPGKKCCGTSCGSKTVDIEDLASSLLLSRAAVTS